MRWRPSWPRGPRGPPAHGRGAAAAAARRLGRRLHLPVAQELDPGRRADLRAGSGVDHGERLPPGLQRGGLRRAMNAGSACVVARVALAEARGAATASGSDIPKSNRLTQDLQHRRDDRRAAGRAQRQDGLPLRSTIVGAIDERGRLPPSRRAGSGVACGRIGARVG